MAMSGLGYKHIGASLRCKDVVVAKPMGSKAWDVHGMRVSQRESLNDLTQLDIDGNESFENSQRVARGANRSSPPSLCPFGKLYGSDFGL